VAKGEPKTFRFTPEVYEAMKRAAAADERSLSNYVEMTLKRDLKARGYLKD